MKRKGSLFACILLFILLCVPLSRADTNPRGLDPWEDATYIPKLGGLLNKTMRNHYGQEKELAECVVLRRSTIEDGKAKVPAGGLYYASSTSGYARPLMRDPFLILGEEAYLLSLKTSSVVKRDVVVRKGEKALLDPAGYRIWYEYATDHYGKPYGEFVLIPPSGGWQIELPISSSFPPPTEVRKVNLKEGINPQQKEFFLSKSILYGATRLEVKNLTHEEAHFSRIEYPVVKEAVFSLDRPYVASIYQGSYRWYWNKRIYAFRMENGILVEVRNWTGRKVLGRKLLVPSTQQEYKVENQDSMSLTLFEHDLHIELVIDPSWYKGSDYAPWANEVPYGWRDGKISFMIYHDLVKVKDGEPWPKDSRYVVRLEADLMTGMLKRLILENGEPFELSNERRVYQGPIKISEVWDRPYFKVVAKNFEKDVVKTCYVRDALFRRTDNLILWKEGRANVDFFIGMSELVVSVMEDTFLQRLADPTYGVPIVKSRFTSYPPVIPSAKWFAPDPDCPFVPKMKGLVREFIRNRRGDKLVSAEAIVIRGSYVDYRKGQIVIPPAGLYYTSRNGRNIRPLDGEAFYILGKKAYLLSTDSYLVVRKNFKIDLWKEYPMGDRNLLFWQDIPLGDGSKALRYVDSQILWGRPVATLRVVKYSGNTWGANIIVGQNLGGYQGYDAWLRSGDERLVERYYIPELFGEGATYMTVKWVSPDFVEVAEMATPGMDSFTFSYNEPERATLGPGEEKIIGDYRLRILSVDVASKSAILCLLDRQGRSVMQKVLGPLTKELLDSLPQFNQSQQKVMLQHKDIHVELDVYHPFENGKVNLYITKGVVRLERDKPWPEDPRFIVRPDVCGHCYMLNELILDNPEPIILDAKNNTYVGPNGYFKIVIDDFDGEKINAWHIEDRTGMKTPNLAEYPRNNVDVMVGVNGTTENFLRRTLLKRLAYREVWRLK